jgi:histidinol-phosphate phosphatase family protein
MINFSEIDKSWTLFLDRDGVINHEKKEAYVLNRSEFVFFEGVKDALKKVADIFGVIVMVTNQKGIGKGLMTVEDLSDIHLYMMDDVKLAGGRIDKIFYCSDLDNESVNRKPNHGMALQAQKAFPQIDFSKSIIVGNKLSDMQFGRNAGMNTVFVATTNPEVPFPHPLIDARFNDLAEFVDAVDSADM